MKRELIGRADVERWTLSTGKVVFLFQPPMLHVDGVPLTPCEQQEVAAEMVRLTSAWAGERGTPVTPVPR